MNTDAGGVLYIFMSTQVNSDREEEMRNVKKILVGSPAIP
jgi:hypothetical protein